MFYWLIIWYRLVHTMGVDNGLRYGTWNWYNFWSGFGSLTLLTAFATTPLVLFRKYNCGVRWCWRIGHHEYKDPETGLTHVLCRKHHPDHPGKPITAAELLRRHRLHLHRTQQRPVEDRSEEVPGGPESA